MNWLKQLFSKPSSSSRRSDGACAFCGKALKSGKGTVSISGSNINDVMKAAQLASANMMARKCVCISCSSIFCLECGNAKGRSLGSGGTHCPKCATKVPTEQLL